MNFTESELLINKQTNTQPSGFLEWEAAFYYKEKGQQRPDGCYRESGRGDLRGVGPAPTTSEVPSSSGGH